MLLEVLHIEACPSWQEAGARARRALDAVGLPAVEVHYRLISTPQEAADSLFAGSPTILIDGEDAFLTRDHMTALACRLYPTDAGLADLPTIGQLVQAIQVHA